MLTLTWVVLPKGYLNCSKLNIGYLCSNHLCKRASLSCHSPSINPPVCLLCSEYFKLFPFKSNKKYNTTNTFIENFNEQKHKAALIASGH